MTKDSAAHRGCPLWGSGPLACPLPLASVQGGQRETDRVRDRDTETQRDRKAQKAQTEKQTDKDRDVESETDTKAETTRRQKERQRQKIETDTERQRKKLSPRQRKKVGDREAETQREWELVSASPSRVAGQPGSWTQQGARAWPLCCKCGPSVPSPTMTAAPRPGPASPR